MYAVFSGNGPLTISSGEYNEITLDAEPSSYNYLLAEITESGELGEMYPVACPESGFQTNYIPAIVTFSGENMLVAGSEPFAENYGTPEERLSNRLFVITAPLANFEAATTEAKEIAEGKSTTTASRVPLLLPTAQYTSPHSVTIPTSKATTRRVISPAPSRLSLSLPVNLHPWL